MLDPDEEVQHAVRRLFELFEQHGSAQAVVKHFSTPHLRFPERLWGKRREGELVWEPLRHSRVLLVLHNPAYAGVYVYGRTVTRAHPLPGETPRVKGHTRRNDRVGSGSISADSVDAHDGREENFRACCGAFWLKPDSIFDGLFEITAFIESSRLLTMPLNPSPSLPDAGRYTFPSRLGCQPEGCGFHCPRAFDSSLPRCLTS